MEQLQIDSTKFSRLVELIKWANEAPSWLDTGDHFWETVNDAQYNLIDGAMPDPVCHEFRSLEATVAGQLYLTVYDRVLGEDVTFECVPVYVCPF